MLSGSLSLHTGVCVIKMVEATELGRDSYMYGQKNYIKVVGDTKIVVIYHNLQSLGTRDKEAVALVCSSVIVVIHQTILLAVPSQYL